MTTALQHPAALDLRSVWEKAAGIDAYIASASPDHRPLWEGIRRTHRPSAVALARRLPAGSKLLVIAADWCGDGVNTIPTLATWAAETGVELRIIDRDSWPEVMDHYLTNGTRAIPIVIVLDAAFRELGHWGPRPVELQQWVLEHLGSMSKEERYKETRRWYARDRGEAIIREVVTAVKA